MESKLDIVVVSAQGEVDYSDQVKSLSDLNKTHLGMMPYSALEDSYARNEIFIATVDDQFAGYLLYRIVPRYRRYSITHLCIEGHFRGEGVPNLLIGSLKDLCIESNYNGISLYCRRDYIGATKVWSNNFFHPIGEKTSRGIEKGVSLNHWWWKNSMCQDLFATVDDDSDVANAVLDMNVLINLKANDSTVLHLLNDSLVGEVDFFVSLESLNEIDRHEEESVRNEVRNYVNEFHQLDFHEKLFNHYVKELKDLLSNITDQEISDIKQLAQTLAAGKGIFITADEGLLAKATALYEIYGVRIFDPSGLWSYLDENAHAERYQPVRLSGTSIELKKVKAHEIQSIGTAFKHPNERRSDLLSTLRRLVEDVDSSEVLLICAGKFMLAVVAITDVSQDESEINVFRVLDSELTFTLSAQLLDFVLKRQAGLKASNLWVMDTYSSLAEEIARAFGFNEVNGSQFKFLKFGEVSIDNLPSYLNQQLSLNNLADVKLKDLSGVNEREALTLEKTMWPLKITDLDVPIYVVPIRAHWAMQLFDEEIASEDMFGPEPRLAFNFENVYYSASKMAIKAPGRIVWYVSGTNSKSPLSGHIRAVSYLDKVDVGTPKSLFSKYKRLGIYDWSDVLKTADSDLNKEIRALIFSRTELLRVPIAFDEFSAIRTSLGHAKPNLVGPLKIDTQTFKAVFDRLY